MTGCGLNEMAVDVKGLTLSKGEGGGQIESSSIPEKSKSLDHIIESQNAPSHLPEKILLTEKSEVLETSSEMEFSGGSGNIFGVTVGGQDTPCELQELSEGYLADSSGLSKEQRNVGTQRRLQETKKSPEGQKNSEFGDLRSSPTQFSKRQKIESFSGVSVLQNSESVEFFGEKLGSFPPVSQIPQGITDTQSQQDLRGMGSPLHEAPSLGTGGGGPCQKILPVQIYFRKQQWTAWKQPQNSIQGILQKKQVVFNGKPPIQGVSGPPSPSLAQSDQSGPSLGWGPFQKVYPPCIPQAPQARPVHSPVFQILFCLPRHQFCPQKFWGITQIRFLGKVLTLHYFEPPRMLVFWGQPQRGMTFLSHNASPRPARHASPVQKVHRWIHHSVSRKGNFSPIFPQPVFQFRIHREGRRGIPPRLNPSRWITDILSDAWTEIIPRGQRNLYQILRE